MPRFAEPQPTPEIKYPRRHEVKAFMEQLQKIIFVDSSFFVRECSLNDENTSDLTVKLMDAVVAEVRARTVENFKATVKCILCDLTYKSPKDEDGDDDSGHERGNEGGEDDDKCVHDNRRLASSSKEFVDFTRHLSFYFPITPKSFWEFGAHTRSPEVECGLQELACWVEEVGCRERLPAVVKRVHERIAQNLMMNIGSMWEDDPMSVPGGLHDEWALDFLKRVSAPFPVTVVDLKRMSGGRDIDYSSIDEGLIREMYSSILSALERKLGGATGAILFKHEVAWSASNVVEDVMRGFVSEKLVEMHAGAVTQVLQEEFGKSFSAFKKAVRKQLTELFEQIRQAESARSSCAEGYA